MQAREDPLDPLNSFDYGAIEDVDPSLVDGFRVIYDREVPIELRVQESAESPQQVGTIEAIKVKMLIHGEDEMPRAVRIELSSEADLFFHYTHNLDEAGFQIVQEQQKLMIEFPDYPNVLIRMLNNCIKEQHAYLAILVMQPDAAARLDFIQNMEYKFLELMSCTFLRSPEDTIQHQITYRYNAMKHRLALMQARLQDINNVVKMKNPSLLLQLQKAPPGALSNAVGGGGGGGASVIGYTGPGGGGGGASALGISAVTAHTTGNGSVGQLPQSGGGRRQGGRSRGSGVPGQRSPERG